MAEKRTDIDFNEFRRLLVKERNVLTRAVSALDEGSAVADGEPANGEALAEMDRSSALDENARAMVKKIDAALDRITAGTYGLDQISGEPIPVERLRAVPWATMTVANAERHGE